MRAGVEGVEGGRFVVVFGLQIEWTVVSFTLL